MAEKTDYVLTEAESALLMAATKDSTAAAGSLGGSVGGGAAGGKGGASSGRFGARFTKPHTALATVTLQLDQESAREHIRTAITESGDVIDDPNVAADGSVWGIVGSGAMNMAPTLVRAQVETTDSGQLRVDVRATGQEGLTKQKIGVKAADRIVNANSSG